MSSEISELPEPYKTVLNWAKFIESIIPYDAFQPIKLQEYASQLIQIYREIVEKE